MCVCVCVCVIVKKKRGETFERTREQRKAQVMEETRFLRETGSGKRGKEAEGELRERQREQRDERQEK